MKVLVSDPLASAGVEMLRSQVEVDVKTGLKPEELESIIGDYDALVVRSQTKVTDKVIQAGKKLKIIARAGVGIDNVDVEEATRRGILVINAPTSNTVSAAEHAIGLIFALARHIPRANVVLKGGEWRRSDFMGVELKGKALGIMGLGRVGIEVAKRARGMEMKLIAYDPYVTPERAKEFDVELVSLEQFFKESDFITIHTVLTAETRGMIGEKELAIMKPTVRIINVARGGIIDEEALAKAVSEKRVAGAAIDCFSVEPVTSSCLFEHDAIICTPHLGASTAEAQVRAATDVAEQILDVFGGKPAKYPVNKP